MGQLQGRALLWHAHPVSAQVAFCLCVAAAAAQPSLPVRGCWQLRSCLFPAGCCPLLQDIAAAATGPDVV